jgi:hypothetical protein
VTLEFIHSVSRVVGVAEEGASSLTTRHRFVLEVKATSISNARVSDACDKNFLIEKRRHHGRGISPAQGILTATG